MSQRLGVSDGKDGMDCRINLRLLLSPGDGPLLWWGGETLLPFGDRVFILLLGGLPFWRTVGISSAEPPRKCFSILEWDLRNVDLPGPSIGCKPADGRIAARDLGGLPFEEVDNGTDGLSHRNKAQHMLNSYLHCRKVGGESRSKISNLKILKGVLGRVNSELWSSSLRNACGSDLLSITCFSEVWASSMSASAPGKPGPNRQYDMKYYKHQDYIDLMEVKRQRNSQMRSEIWYSLVALTILPAKCVFTTLTSAANGAPNTTLQNKRNSFSMSWSWKTKNDAD